MRAVLIHVHGGISSVVPNDQLDLSITDKAHKTSIVLQNVEVVAANQQVGLVEVFVSPDEAQRVTDADNHREFSLRL